MLRFRRLPARVVRLRDAALGLRVDGRADGDRWREWGSEQVASNLVVANLPGGTLLPHARYCAPHRRRPQTAFLHFIGYVRFTTGLYSELARKVASELRESAPAATGASPVGSVR